MSENEVERGAAEEQSGAPLTETEAAAGEPGQLRGSGEAASEADVEGGGSSGTGLGGASVGDEDT